MKNLINGQKRLVKIRRPFGSKDANLTGVSEGIAEYLQISPWYVRIGFVGLALWLKWPIALLYAGLAFFLPSHDSRRSMFEEFKPIRSKIAKNPSQEEEESYIVCENCETAVLSGSKFCHHCGNRL